MKPRPEKKNEKAPKTTAEDEEKVLRV